MTMRHKNKLLVTLIAGLMIMSLTLVSAQENNMTEEDQQMEHEEMDMEQRMHHHMQNMEYCIQSMQMMDDMEQGQMGHNHG